MKVLLVLTWSATDRSYRSRLSTWLSYAPLTLGSLAAIIKDERPSWDIETVDEMSKKVDPERHYDIVMISSTTPGVKRGYALAEMFRKKGAHVVMGGYHVTINPDEALKYCDTVIIGPGDYALREFIRDYENGTPQPKYDHPDVKGADILPPDRRYMSMKGYYKMPPLLANPGCRNRCSYCVISDMWRCSGVRPVENVIAEIKAIGKKNFIFYDPNFFGNREYSIKLMEALTPLKIKWVGSATINLGFDDELLSLARKSGCSGLLFGFESMSREALLKTRKGFNDPNNYKQAIANIQSYGIMCNGCFILGMDGDSEEDLLSLPEQINYLNLNLARFAVLTPVPGTEIFNKMDEEGRIFDKDWDHYTQHKAVFKPLDITPERLEEIYRYVWKETYRMKNIMKRVTNVKGLGPLKRILCFGANIGFKYLGIS